MVLGTEEHIPDVENKVLTTIGQKSVHEVFDYDIADLGDLANRSKLYDRL